MVPSENEFQAKQAGLDDFRDNESEFFSNVGFSSQVWDSSLDPDYDDDGTSIDDSNFGYIPLEE
ncbi:hypothetical protein HK096_006810, partial [Nowakowskiella sp. JEL0078]